MYINNLNQTRQVLEKKIKNQNMGPSFQINVIIALAAWCSGNRFRQWNRR
jgi:hypothetical protein